DRRDRYDRSACLAAGDRLGRKVQIRASGSRRGAAFADSRVAAPLESSSLRGEVFRSPAGRAHEPLFRAKAYWRHAARPAKRHAKVAYLDNPRRSRWRNRIRVREDVHAAFRTDVV